MGDNGAGKSTLIETIAGIFPPDGGEMRFGGQPITLRGPKDASRLGLATVYQDLALCDNTRFLATSRLLAVNQSSGGGDVLLDAIAAAVIGGTSLFGGRRTVWSALTGALLIGSISNGMDLPALPSSVKFMVTGAALLAAVAIEALARSGRQPAGRS
ncbi:ATP-binding cassette domain-containing protein [Sorangium sp. So ce834]|uniref:ATP-binding cassette domain-containing protein n=1 Tax=Sorangium sp. So ce834 TaxID=3133321 RepID=UPI003F6195E6